MSKYVQISSQLTITVTGPLYYKDVTNKTSLAPDKLNVQTMGTGLKCQIKQGVDFYPTNILEWESVKKLADLGKIVIGLQTDTCDKSAELDENAKVLEDEVKRAEEAGCTTPEKAKKTRTKKTETVEVAE